MAFLLKFNVDTCTGCRICEIICSLTHFGEINTKVSNIKYKDEWPKVGKIYFCRQCKSRNCIESCPVEGAININSYGLVAINVDKCTGCMRCSEACPFGNLPTDGQFPLFCDTCSGHYKCVEWCPGKALAKGGE